LANGLAQDIERMLSGVMGDFIASATLKKNCELIGTNTDGLTAAQLPDLADKIEKSIAFFNNADTARDLAQKIKALG
jgi:hypothetical protein